MCCVCAQYIERMDSAALATAELDQQLQQAVAFERYNEAAEIRKQVCMHWRCHHPWFAVPVWVFGSTHSLAGQGFARMQR